MSDFLKAEQIDVDRWRICAIPFGGPLKGGRDMDGEYFSPRTDIKPDWFSERPVLFHHGKDRRIKDAQVGRESDLHREDDGWWAEMWLNRQSEYFEVLESLISAGKMYGSSGTIDYLSRRAPDNREILVWPHVEQTITLTPSNIFARVSPKKAVDDFTLASLPTDFIKTVADLVTLADDLRPTLPDLRASGAMGGGDDAIAAERRLADIHELVESLRHI